MKMSPFLDVSPDDWIVSDDWGFAFFDRFPVSPGHTLVVTRRIVPDWFAASEEERRALMEMVALVKDILDKTLNPKPDGYNVGFNCGEAAGQTVMHLHIHVIPRFKGDMDDPRGGVRHAIPHKGNYLAGKTEECIKQPSLSLTVGQPHSPLWRSIDQRVSSASEVDILASFIQPSGLDLIQGSIFSALRAGAHTRILVGDYLYITSAEALSRLVGWMSLADDIGEPGSLAVRLAEISKLESKPDSFHPKAWRIVDSSGGLLVVGSSNLSKAALETGVEWNLIGRTTGSGPLDIEMARAFTDLWCQATPLDGSLVARYAEHAKEAHRKFIPPESVDLPSILHLPRPWQMNALESLDQIRTDNYRRALVAVATGLGKTWLAAFDVLAVGKALNRKPRVLIIAHRAEILIQAEATFRTAMQSEWEDTRVTWYLGANSDMSGDLVVASIQKLTRPEGLAELDCQHFDYVAMDEARESASEVVAGEHVALEAGVPAHFLASLELGGVDSQGLDDVGFRDGQVQSSTKHDLFLRREVESHECFSGRVPEGCVLQAVEEIGVERTKPGCRLGLGRLSLGSEALPDFVPVTTEGVEWHLNVRLVTLSFKDEFPVVAETGNEADIEPHPSIGNVPEFDEINDREQHDRHMGSNPACSRAGCVEVGKFTKPVGTIAAS